MPTTFGNTAFADARTSLLAELDALKADMVTNVVVPRFDAIYDTHWEEPFIDFNALSISFETVEGLTLSPNRYEFMYRVECRIMTGWDNQNFDEETFYNLANSVVNWILTYGASMSNNFRFKSSEPITVEPNVHFEDTRTVGGLVKFTIYGVEVYTPA